MSVSPLAGRREKVIVAWKGSIAGRIAFQLFYRDERLAV